MEVEEKLKKVSGEFWGKATTIALASLGVVAALAWNAAIMAVFEKYFSIENTLFAKICYAILVTILLTIVTMWLSKKNTEQPLVVNLNNEESEVKIPLELKIKIRKNEEPEAPA
jgi:uncharacterized membrane protein